jgi:hypothetical protein
LQGTTSSDAIMGDPGFTGMGSTSTGGAVQILEQLLKSKKQYCPDGGTHVATTAPCGSRESSVTSMSTVQSLWDLNFNNQARRQSEGISIGTGPYMTPTSDVTRHSSMASLGRGGGTPMQRQQQQQSRITSMAPSMSSATSTTGNTPPHSQAMYEFDPQLSLHQTTFQQHHGNIATHSQLAQAHTASHALAPVSRSSQYNPTTATSGAVAGTSSCVFATDMITTMAGGDPHIVRADLGCIPQAMECQVDNQLVFNVMDRYTGSGVGL